MKSFVMKMLTVSIVGLLLLIAGSMLRSVVDDRLQNRNLARASITESLAGEQTLAGVSLVIPYVEHYQELVVNEKTKAERLVPRQITRRMELLPERVDTSGQLFPDRRYRGVFRVNGYVLHGGLSGHFALPAADTFVHEYKDSRLEFGVARMVLAISDPRGLRKLEMNFNGMPRVAEAGGDTHRSGGHAKVDDIAKLLGHQAKFDISLELVGTDSLNIVPLGRENTASLTSPWQHPSFGGRFLPVDRKISDSGFDAKWRISSLATNASEVWLSGNSKGDKRIDSFSISLIDPVDIYVMSDRAGKYASLFIAITLGGFLLFELLRSLRLHALHYLLIGAALLIFFLLLLALSERLGFGPAYAIAASACVLLIGTYSANLLRSKWLALGFSIGLGSLYGALYVILLSEQNALLMGSLLIFALLTAVMLGTRKVDWHLLLAERPALTPRD